MISIQDRPFYKSRWSTETIGLVYGLLGVIGFSLTLPASRFAVNYFGATIVGPGRALIAAILAFMVLWIRKEKRPARSEWFGLGIVAFGAILAFPYLTAWAMAQLPASHGAVELALLPLATAGASALRNGERPSIAYWVSSILGAVTVLGYAVSSGLSGIHSADIALVAAVVIVAFSYAEGGRLATVLGGWQVIAWALVLVAPFIVLTVVLNFPLNILDAPLSAWVSLIYLGIGSQFLAFVAWYSGLGIGGVARVSQVQYFQPFFTILFSVFLLREALSFRTLIASLIVVGVVAFGKKTAIRKKSEPGGESSKAT
jgi:drug/metabolite transporter (DMT)-like permease